MNSLRTNEQKQESYFTSSGKGIVAEIRSENYAHAGEEEAIDIFLEGFERSYLDGKKKFKVVDVGCGLGGTAEYLRGKGFGDKVYGFDIDSIGIEKARKKYPKINYFVEDIHFVHRKIEERFDVLTMFNVFYELSNQEECLKSLNGISNCGGILAIFDYTNNVGSRNSQLVRSPSGNCVPIELDKIEAVLSRTGWKLLKIVDLSQKFQSWYEKFMENMVKKKEYLVEKYSFHTYYSYYYGYNDLLTSIRKKETGGAMIYCQKI